MLFRPPCSPQGQHLKASCSQERAGVTAGPGLRCSNRGSDQTPATQGAKYLPVMACAGACRPNSARVRRVLSSVPATGQTSPEPFPTTCLGPGMPSPPKLVRMCVTLIHPLCLSPVPTLLAHGGGRWEERETGNTQSVKNQAEIPVAGEIVRELTWGCGFCFLKAPR